METQQLIQAEDGGSNPTSPHQFHIKEIPKEIAISLNKQYHRVLPEIKNVTLHGNEAYYGFFFKGSCYAVALWSSPIARALPYRTHAELRRFAINDSSPKNTASWGLARMAHLIKKKYPSLKLLVSYQAVKIHEGTIYRAAGWNEGVHTKPSSWVRKGKGRQQNDYRQIVSGTIRWEREL